MNKTATEERKAYYKVWRKEHPQIIADQQERYWTKRALKMKADTEVINGKNQKNTNA